MPLAVRPGDFSSVVKALGAAGFAGVNVTLPHKEAAVLLCNEVSEAARLAGAVNTIVFREGGIFGDNTDGAGFVANLRAHGAEPGAGPALILGAGGAARAIGAALLAAGAEVKFCNRTEERAAALAAALGGGTLPWAAREEALGEFGLLVNATSLGMKGQPALEMDLARASAGLVVADIVYAPLETALLKAARDRGLRAVEGLGMLLHQAVPGFEAWFGVRPVVDAALYELAAGDG